MRQKIAAALCALAMCAAPSALGQSAGQQWTYAYIDGVATATQRDEEDRVTATFTCRPPTGDIVITDLTFGRAARRANRATVGIGNMTVNVPVTVEGRGRNMRVMINLPQRPPILAGLQPDDRVTVVVNNTTHVYGSGSAARMSEVAYACWAGGA